MKSRLELKPQSHWVFYDRRLKELKLFGSITELHRQQDLFENNNKLNIRQLRYRLEKSREWKSDRYIIQECEIQRSKMNRLSKKTKMKSLTTDTNLLQAL